MNYFRIVVDASQSESKIWFDIRFIRGVSKIRTIRVLIKCSTQGGNKVHNYGIGLSSLLSRAASS